MNFYFDILGCLSEYFTFMMGVMLSCCPQGIFSADPVPSAKYKQSRKKQLTTQLRDTGNRHTRETGSKNVRDTQCRGSPASVRRNSIQPPRSSERRGSFINFEDSSTSYGSMSMSKSTKMDDKRNLLLAPSKTAHRRRASVY